MKKMIVILGFGMLFVGCGSENISGTDLIGNDNATQSGISALDQNGGLCMIQWKSNTGATGNGSCIDCAAAKAAAEQANRDYPSITHTVVKCEPVPVVAIVDSPHRTVEVSI